MVLTENDACPCGSGKKYKKCCSGATEGCWGTSRGLVRTFKQLREVDPGFDRDHVISFTVDTALSGYSPKQTHRIYGSKHKNRYRDSYWGRERMCE